MAQLCSTCLGDDEEPTDRGLLSGLDVSQNKPESCYEKIHFFEVEILFDLKLCCNCLLLIRIILFLLS